MYISVDDTGDGEVVQGFQYTNKRGVVERVHINDEGSYIRSVSMRDEADEEVSILYIEDIPKLIKALQMAYNHINRQGE